jgi:hypothetical protein
MQKVVDFQCPLCHMTIKSTPEKWEPRVVFEEDENRIQYAHQKCVDGANDDRIQDT